MKLKEAIEILQAFTQVAGEDAEVSVHSFTLNSGLHIEYSSYGVGYGDREKSRKVIYTIDAVLPQAEVAQQFNPHAIDCGRLTG